jgi:hypothetical protein
LRTDSNRASQTRPIAATSKRTTPAPTDPRRTLGSENARRLCLSCPADSFTRIWIGWNARALRSGYPTRGRFLTITPGRFGFIPPRTGGWRKFPPRSRPSSALGRFSDGRHGGILPPSGACARKPERLRQLAYRLVAKDCHTPSVPGLCFARSYPQEEFLT